MIRIDFTPEEIEKLRYERFNHPHPRIQLKMEALLLKSQGVKHQKICQILGICHDTLTAYLKGYQNGGINKLKELNYYRPQSKLEDYHSTLEAEFFRNPPATIKEAAIRIRMLTGIQRSYQQIGNWLKKNRITPIKSIGITSQSRCRRAV